jgi:hypothetical protein
LNRVRKQLISTLLFCLIISHSKCQVPFQEENVNPEKLDVSPIKELGYTATGLGISIIGNTAFKIVPVKNSTPWYIGGGALLATGLYLLLFANDDYKPKYWKGLHGYAPGKNKASNDLFLFSGSFPVGQKNLQMNRSDMQQQRVLVLNGTIEQVCVYP